MRTYSLALLGILCSTGCVVVHDNPPPPGPGPSGPPVYHIQPGAGTIIAAGTQPGYGITASLGGNYRAVWTGEASGRTYSNFTGTIYTPGHFQFVQPGCDRNACPVESNDAFSDVQAVAGGGEQFSFDTVATSGIDGVDFQVTLEPVDFDLVIDGVRYPDLVFFTNTDTQAVVSPGEIPFDLTTN